MDCLMNLPLLYWAAQENESPAWKQIAIEHTEMALRYILRPDGSSNHMVDFDPKQGNIKIIPEDRDMKAAPPGAEANPGPFRDGSGIPLYEKSGLSGCSQAVGSLFYGKCFFK